MKKMCIWLLLVSVLLGGCSFFEKHTEPAGGF
jgi:uncharacterized protein YceK